MSAVNDEDRAASPPLPVPALLPCPFCGGSAYLMKREEGGHTTRSTEHWVRCHGCGMDGNHSDDKSWAVEQWNRRASSSAQREREAVLEEAAQVAHQFDGAKTTNTDVLVYAIRQRTAIATAIRSLKATGEQK